MANIKKPSQKKLRILLNESLVDPRKPGLLTVILESDNPRYLVERSMEMLREALIPGSDVPTFRIRDAITILAMSRLLMAQQQEKPSEKKKPKARGKQQSKGSDTQTGQPAAKESTQGSVSNQQSGLPAVG